MLNHNVVTTIVAGLFLMAFTTAALAQETSDASADASESTKIVLNDDLEWADIQPEGFGPGMQVAALSGDPSVADEPYVLRLSFEDGYRIPAHFHPKAENVTVVSGTFMLAMGEKEDDSRLQSYSPGDYLYIPGEHPHYGTVEGETVIQLHGMGPFEIRLADEGLVGSKQ